MTPMLKTGLLILLEAYPRTIAYQSFLSVYEQHSPRTAENPLNSFRSQLAKERKRLAAVGLRIVAEWGHGFKLEISL